MQEKQGIIITGPSTDDLRPTQEQIREQEHLRNWEKYSKQDDWVVGEPHKPYYP